MPATTQDGTADSRQRRAVELRLAGAQIAEIRAQTGLSAPTIIGACRAFREGGWAALSARRRGRPAGAQRLLSEADETELHRMMLTEPPPAAGSRPQLWTRESVAVLARSRFGLRRSGRALSRVLERAGLCLPTLAERAAHDAALAAWRQQAVQPLQGAALRTPGELVWCGEYRLGEARVLVAQSLRGRLAWLPLSRPFLIASWIDFLDRLLATWPGIRGVLLHGIDVDQPQLCAWAKAHAPLHLIGAPSGPGPARREPSGPSPGAPLAASAPGRPNAMTLTHLQRLEAESIHIMREVIAESERPVMLYTAGKDSATMLHLARKAFFPATPPFPLLHIDTTWEFREMYAMRERVARDCGMTLIVHRNPEALRLGINPFTHGSQIHADLWNTEGLRQALDSHRFDVAFGGARRDEEKSRAKERVFSFRNAQHRWDPKNQRPELWNLYNARKSAGESIRVFPLSNWTELDVWQYIHRENVPIVPLYLARERPVVERNGTLLMVDDERMPLQPGEVPVMRKVRFRTLGCYPLSGAIESEATTLPAVIDEMLRSRQSERQGRLIDHDGPASMERKKQEGYF
jgi:sulfate adenylyltransferase subunit 2